MKDATEVLFIIDKSGSMEGLTSDVIGGFNTFVKEQKEIPGELWLTLVSFNHVVDFHSRRNLRDITSLDSIMRYRADGMTALYDAVGTGIEELGKALAALPEADRPSKVMVVIMTDGMENSSKRFSQNHIAEMIEHQRTRYNWQFLFMGANIDPKKEAGKINIAPQSAHAYKASAGGMRSAYACISKSVSSVRTGSSTGGGSGSQLIDWSDRLQQEQDQLPQVKK